MSNTQRMIPIINNLLLLQIFLIHGIIGRVFIVSLLLPFHLLIVCLSHHLLVVGLLLFYHLLVTLDFILISTIFLRDKIIHFSLNKFRLGERVSPVWLWLADYWHLDGLVRRCGFSEDIVITLLWTLVEVMKISDLMNIWLLLRRHCNAGQRVLILIKPAKRLNTGTLSLLISSAT